MKQSRSPRVQRITASVHGIGDFDFYMSERVSAEFINTSMTMNVIFGHITHFQKGDFIQQEFQISDLQ